jgi:uncharacterized MAPEG superfamily protein
MNVAIFCVLLAALLPIYYTGVAKFATRKSDYDNRRVREFQATLTGRRQRAHWAHLNSLEAFAPFAAAVILALHSGVRGTWIDALAVAFIGLRLIYGWCYLNDHANARSVAWMGAFACVIALFILALLR